jgi:predicted dehydrogenase
LSITRPPIAYSFILHDKIEEMKNLNVGMIGAGGIAKKLAATIEKLDGFTNYAIASRSLDKATAFKNDNYFTKAYGSYEELMEDENVDLVYIATPHSEHHRNMLLALKHHKPVLDEKAFTTNAIEAKDIIERFEKENLFLTEAIWTRYMPSRKIIDDIIKENLIGKISLLEANLCYPNKSHARLNDPNLAGGALLDMGIYPLTFALMALGSYPDKVEATCLKSETGVDETTFMRLSFPSNVEAILYTSMDVSSDRTGYIYGDNGYIKVFNINNPEAIEVHAKDQSLVKRVEIKEDVNGYEYELYACKKALEEGELECPEIPHSDIIKVMELLDEIRRKIDLRYPFER